MKDPPALRILVVAGCVLAIGIAVAWLYWPMRAVLDVGGYCAEGGPYVIETHCPDGSTTFLMLGVPLWMLGVFLGFVASTIGAPLPVFPGWALLFGALGWNFVDYAFHGDPAGVVGSWLVCGIVFWLMALPALVIFVGGRFRGRAIGREPAADRAWVLADVVLLAVGFLLGAQIVR